MKHSTFVISWDYVQGNELREVVDGDDLENRDRSFEAQVRHFISPVC